MSSQDQNADLTMVDPGSDHFLLDEAIEVIQLSLSEDHRRTFHHDADPNTVLTELRKAATCNNASDATRFAARRFALFVRAFAPYFHVLDVFTVVRPEWIGCFWGLLLSLHQILSNHVVFLEKFADILEAVANLLPAYEQIYNFCRNDIGAAQERIEDRRLSTLISFVYADLTSLFLDVYRIFNRGPAGPRWRLWHFETVPTSQWRPLDSRFAHLEARVTQHRRWLESETRSRVQDFAEIQSYRMKYVDFLQRHTEPKGNDSVDHDQQRVSKRLKRVEKIKDWISSNSHLPSGHFGRLQVQDLGSCQWFLELEKYRNWKNARSNQVYETHEEELRATWHDRVLFVQGQPGFGKTVLAQAVIDDLTAETEDFDIGYEPPSLSFFHANTQQPHLTQLDDVFRTLAVQLLDCHRHDHATLDAVCLLLRKTSFQGSASPTDVLDLLAILLRQHSTFLVIDGLESIANVPDFLGVIAELCRNADSRVILFSRPGISIPLEYQKWASDAPHIVSLEDHHNTLSIEQYLTAALDQLNGHAAFAVPIGQAAVSDIAQLAGGSFLWAAVLIKYLQTPALTRDDRTVILEHVHSLQGMEALYSLVLQALESRPVPAKRIIKDVFRWLAHPIHGLCSSALRTAIAVALNPAELEEVFPTTDIIDALPELTCGLVTVMEDGVSFTHPSLLEFLQSPTSQRSKFSLYDENSVHAHLAARCLYYLAHKVPKRPLCGLSPQIRPMLPSSGASQRTSKSGDSGYKSLSSSDGDNNNLPLPAIELNQHSNHSQVSVRTIPFDTNLPFLRYAALCWPVHLSRALAPSNRHHCSLSAATGDGSMTAVPYLFPLSAFLSSRLAVTAWVEASFRYNLPPTLTRLVGPLSDLKSEISSVTIEGQELRLVVQELSVLSDRLMQLKRELSPALRENPSLIWQMEDTGADECWPVWDGSTGMPR